MKLVWCCICVFLLGLSLAREEMYSLGILFDIDEASPAPLRDNFGFGGRSFTDEVEVEERSSGKGLQEFRPISNTITQSQVQTYSFNVNTTAGIGEYYELLIFLTGNICSQPDDTSDSDSSLTVYYSFNASMFDDYDISEMAQFDNGYFQALADVPILGDDENQDTILYIAVRAPESTNKTASWSYQIGVSQNDLVFQWDDRSWASLVDTDDNSALIVTGNLTGKNNVNYTDMSATESKYSLYIYSWAYRNYFKTLNSSWCAIRNGPALLTSSNFESSYTTRGGGLQQQFYVTGLNSSTKYVAYLLSNFRGTDYGGAVYQPFDFETLDSDVCSLVYDLDFCDRVAYSVPKSPGRTKNETGQLFDDRANSLFSNFSKALQQVACDTTKEAKFSPIKSCSDCVDSYKDWLCAVTIPRCSSRNITGYKYRDVGENRNSFITDEIKPDKEYFEVLPCVNVCYAMVRDCPAALGFQCPTHNKTVKLSYYWDDGGDYATCNYVGKINYETSNAIKLFARRWWSLAPTLMILLL